MKRYDETIATQYYKQETRKLTSVVCDICGKEFKPSTGYRDRSARYIRVHTWNDDYGSESHHHRDLCKDCAAKFVSVYIMSIEASEELELRVEYVDDRETDGTDYIPISKKDVK